MSTRILAIDPGYERLGIAILEKNLGDKKETLLYSDCFKTSAKLAFVTRLAHIGKELERLIDEFQPRALSIETLFFSNNQKTAMRVSEARGVIIYTMSSRGLPVHEYTPLQIKIAVTGHGKSDKEQVIAMVPRLIDIKKEIAHDDEYDAIAIGLTCMASEYRKIT
jgi:crossover junction endodeoxyribonuclease RuvC